MSPVYIVLIGVGVPIVWATCIAALARRLGWTR